MTVPRLVHEVLRSTTARFIREPWWWPREDDLVCELVAELKAGLGPGGVPLELDLPGRLADIRHGARQTIQVRRELKIGTARSRERDEKVGEEDRQDSQRQRHDDRFDVAVLKDTSVRLKLAANGPRDVVLKARPSDVVALIEVKVYPEHYFQGRGESPWLEDIRKLHSLDLEALRCAVALDTSIPTEAAGITWKRAPANLSATVRLPPWPLKALPFEVQTTIRKAACVLRFTPVATPAPTGTYLYAPALTPGSTWLPRVDVRTRVVPLVPSADMMPCCWQVESAS